MSGVASVYLDQPSEATRDHDAQQLRITRPPERAFSSTFLVVLGVARPRSRQWPEMLSDGREPLEKSPFFSGAYPPALHLACLALARSTASLELSLAPLSYPL